MSQPTQPGVLDGTYTTSTFDAVGTTIKGFLGATFFSQAGEPPETSPSGTVGLLGRNVSDGGLGAPSDYLSGKFPQLNINLADVVSPTAIIQQAVLVNNGELISSEGSSVVITASADAVIVNNGTIFGEKLSILDAALTGTGQLILAGSGRDLYPTLRLTKAVSEEQNIAINIGLITVADPIDFRPTIVALKEFAFPTGLILETGATSGFFINHTLTLINGSLLVAQFKFANDITAENIAVDVGPTITTVRPSFHGRVPGNITLATTGNAPMAPPIRLPTAPTLLPTIGPDRTVSNAALVASTQFLNGYTIRLENPFATTQASLSISSVTFGSTFALRVDALPSGQSHGNLYAVGYNANAGRIQAAGSGSTLTVDIEDITAPDGVVVLAGAFNNTGRLASESGGTLRVTGPADSKLINGGTVVTNGMTFISPTVTGTGAMTVGTHGGVSGSLELGGYVSTGQAITLAAGTLTVDDVRHFYATVYDFDARDAIVLKGVDVQNVTYDNGKLLLDGGVDGALHFHRPNGVTYTSASFQLSHSGGDTILTTAVRTA